MTLKEFICPPQAKPITPEMLQKLQDSLAKYWKNLGMEVELGPPHGHFLDRLNDSRNGKQISYCECQKLFAEVFHKYGPIIAKKHPNYEAVMTDIQTKLNIPFILKLDPKTKALEIVAKTALRKSNFMTPDPKFAVEELIKEDQDYDRSKKAQNQLHKAHELVTTSFGYKPKKDYDEYETEHEFTHPSGQTLKIGHYHGAWPMVKNSRLRTGAPRSHFVEFQHSGKSEHTPGSATPISKLKKHLDSVHVKNEAINYNNMNTKKTYRDLKEWLGFNTPTVAPITTVQAVDDIDSAAFSVEEPVVLDKLNAYCNDISTRPSMNPYYPLNALWSKLSLIGLHFDLKKLLITGDVGRLVAPLTQFGGRYGVLGNPSSFISSDDGTRVPGGLNLVVTYIKTGGVYSLEAQIEHGSDVLEFDEAIDPIILKKKQ